MPTYRNDTQETRHVYDINDCFLQIAPGASIQTYKFLGAGWTQTDEAPVFNPVAFSTEVTLTEDGTDNSYIEFDFSKIKFLRIHDVSDTITAVHAQNVTVLPPLYTNITAASANLPEINNEDGKLRKLVFKGTGTCKVTGYLS